MLPQRIEVGRRQSHVVIVAVTRKEGRGNYWLTLRCDCGIEFRGTRANFHRVTCCGCTKEKPHTRHGMSQTPLYKVWNSMVGRTISDAPHNYKYYKGRGIGVCARWRLFRYFYEDMGPTYQKGLSLDRIDNDRGYCPDNCRWVTPKQQSNNRRDNLKYWLGGSEMTLNEIAKQTGISYQTIYARLRSGKSIREAVRV